MFSSLNIISLYQWLSEDRSLSSWLPLCKLTRKAACAMVTNKSKPFNPICPGHARSCITTTTWLKANSCSQSLKAIERASTSSHWSANVNQDAALFIPLISGALCRLSSQSWASGIQQKEKMGYPFLFDFSESPYLSSHRPPPLRSILCLTHFESCLPGPGNHSTPSSSSTVIASRDNCITEAEPISLPLDLLYRRYFLLEFPFF